MAIDPWWALVPAAYLLGSVSFAYWAGRLHGIDLRRVGSGNLGATNAGRVLGGRWFAIVFAADLLKGLLPTALAQLAPLPWLPVAVGAAAVLGHVLTCFHGFKGGKAVATSLGVLLAIAPVAAALAGAAWLAVWLAVWRGLGLARSEAVGPASIIAALVAPAGHLLDPGRTPITLGFIGALALLVVLRHVSNARRFLAALRAPHSPPSS
ncbi:MAG: glycerol-3-phosphate acyltransferase [Planctomycetota bacterium]|nr:glycerol-3-phosphate acyltransferase [Planctomycetota bacterium]MCX8040142.1 glycerol-3-phosphate acyltransferase [Planctomycetota bacterium]MDW8373400.1 glycerol-3-phosphate acyltransferase [Planctomycetota bacterium]